MRARLFIGGGQDYHGPTAERDKAVVPLVARYLFDMYGNSIEIITGGMPGIPEDFALAWSKAGGQHVLCVVSSDREEEYLRRQLPFNHQIIGETLEKRRIAIFKLPRLKCAIFIQGGKYSTHEMKLLDENKVPIVPFWGSGGAAGGDPSTAYEGYTWTKKPDTSPYLMSDDPSMDVHFIAKSMAYAVVI
jgi:hypothetical protein